MRFSLRQMLVAVTACAAIAVLASAANRLGNELMYGADDAYAQWGMADMLVAYMDANGGDWPRDWEDLRPLFATHSRCSDWSFEKLQDRIRIDFDADVESMRYSAKNSEKPEFDVIEARYSESFWGEGPDHQIWSYLRNTS